VAGIARETIVAPGSAELRGARITGTSRWAWRYSGQNRFANAPRVEASALPTRLAASRAPFSAAFLRLRSDEQLVAMFRAGSDEAFRAIHDRYRARLLAYTRQMLRGAAGDPADALLDTFMRAYRSLRANDRPVLLRAWLYRIAHNRCIDELRRPCPLPSELAADAEPAFGAPSATREPPAVAERSAALARLVADVRTLPTQQRSALLMRELQGLTYEELASALSVSVPAVKSLLLRARTGLIDIALARDTPCIEIRDELVCAADRGVRISGRARRHCGECAGCDAYRGELRRVRRGFAALTPSGPLAQLGMLFGIGGGGAAAAGGSGSAAAGGGALAGMTAAKIAVAVCCAALVTTAGRAVIDPSSSSPAPRPVVYTRSAPRSVAVSAPAAAHPSAPAPAIELVATPTSTPASTNPEPGGAVAVGATGATGATGRPGGGGRARRPWGWQRDRADRGKRRRDRAGRRDRRDRHHRGGRHRRGRGERRAGTRSHRRHRCDRRCRRPLRHRPVRPAGRRDRCERCERHRADQLSRRLVGPCAVRVGACAVSSGGACTPENPLRTPFTMRVGPGRSGGKLGGARCASRYRRLQGAG
jgi:RNA polymerase sigma factor (sigma-70 family)